VKVNQICTCRLLNLIVSIFSTFQNANVAKLESIVEDKRREEESDEGRNKVGYYGFPRFLLQQ
jgi:hypothetical protein